MKTFERWAMHLGALLTGASGLIYGWLRYYGQTRGDFGPEPHPLQGVAQHLHVLAAPLLLFSLGMMVRGHLSTKLRTGAPEGRRTGLVLGLLIFPMVAGGYLVQVATTPAWRMAFAWVHGISSLVFLASYIGHGLRSWLKPAPQESPEESMPAGWD